MDNYIRLLDVLAWPAVALVAVLLFRKDLSSILRRIRQFETSTAKMMFNEELEQVERTIPETPRIESEESNKWLSEMKAIAKLNPRAAIIEAWTSIEIACVELGLVQGATMPRFSPKALEEFLFRIPDFDREMIKRVMDLRRLRNRVTHGMDAEFEFIDAEKYIELADKTVSALNTANKLKHADAKRRAGV